MGLAMQPLRFIEDQPPFSTMRPLDPRACCSVILFLATNRLRPFLLLPTEGHSIYSKRPRETPGQASVLCLSVDWDTGMAVRRPGHRVEQTGWVACGSCHKLRGPMSSLGDCFREPKLFVHSQMLFTMLRWDECGHRLQGCWL